MVASAGEASIRTPEGGRQEGKEEEGRCQYLPPDASVPCVLLLPCSSGGWLFPEANLGLTWAATSPKTLFE